MRRWHRSTPTDAALLPRDGEGCRYTCHDVGMTDDDVPNVPQSPEVLNEQESRAAGDGYVARTGFARWVHDREQTTALIEALRRTFGDDAARRDFLAGFLTGAEDEHVRQSDPDADSQPYAIEWH